jgi:glycosyltransferase involved in cell wall biosynthesis
MPSKVSVLIPVYNREALVARAIESARSQTHADLEIVVSDNASSDGTCGVIQRLAQADPRIHLLRNETNLGPTRNWIRGLAECRGDYVKILWSDDWLEPTCIEELLRPMKVDPSIGLAFTSVIVHYANRDLVMHHFPDRTGFTSAEYLADGLMRGKTPASPGCSLVRRDFARFRMPIGDDAELNRIAERFGAGPDLLFLLEAAAGSARVAHVPKFLTHFGASQSSITVNHPREVEEGYRRVRDWFGRQLPARPDLARLRTRLSVRRWRRTLKRALHL